MQGGTRMAIQQSTCETIGPTACILNVYLKKKKKDKSNNKKCNVLYGYECAV